MTFTVAARGSQPGVVSWTASAGTIGNNLIHGFAEPNMAGRLTPAGVRRPAGGRETLDVVRVPDERRSVP